jgi:hypothetical protein
MAKSRIRWQYGLASNALNLAVAAFLLSGGRGESALRTP